MAVRRGVAVGGGRDLVPAAARRARPGADHAVADARAVRPARGAGRDRPLPGVPDRDQTRVPPPGHRGIPPRGRNPVRRRARALRRRVRGRRGAAAGAAGRAARRARRARQLDVGGHPCGAAAAGLRHRDLAPGPDRDRLAPAEVRRLGGRVLATGVRLRAVARAAARGGRGAEHVRRADEPLRARRRAPPESAGDGGRSGAVADRPGDDGARVERARLPGEPRVPQLLRAEHSPPPCVGQRRGPLRPRGGARARRRARPRLRGPRERARPQRRCVRVRARHRAARALVVRGRRVAGGRGRRGGPPGARADDARRRARTSRHRTGPARSRREQLGGGRGSANVEQPRRRRPRVGRRGRRS